MPTRYERRYVRIVVLPKRRVRDNDIACGTVCCSLDPAVSNVSVTRPPSFYPQKVWNDKKAWGNQIFTDDEPHYIENEVPHPHELVAFGFSMTNRAPISSSEKSITALDKKGKLTESTTTF